MKIKILLDDSGSMGSVKAKVPMILKNAFKECKNHGVHSEVHITFLNENSNKTSTVTELAQEFIGYYPFGGTPLYKKIINLLAHPRPNTLYMILSDGKADDTHSYLERARALVQRTSSISNNRIIYLGEGENAFKSARDIGIFNVLNFTKEDMEMLGRIIANEIIQYHNKIMVS